MRVIFPDAQSELSIHSDPTLLMAQSLGGGESFWSSSDLLIFFAGHCEKGGHELAAAPRDRRDRVGGIGVAWESVRGTAEKPGSGHWQEERGDKGPYLCRGAGGKEMMTRQSV